MRIVELKCPNCGATIQVDEDRDFCFCSYCGTKSMIDNGTIHIIDEAKIREAEAFEKVRIAEAEAKLQAERDKQNNKMLVIMVVISLIIGFGAMIFLKIFG